MGKKGDFERDMGAGARQTGLNISETADPLGFFSLTTISMVYSEWSKNRKYPVNYLDGNALSIPEFRGKWPDCFELA